MAMAGGFGVGSGGIQGSSGGGSVNGAAITPSSVTASGNGTFGSLTVTTPGDLTLGAASDVVLGNTQFSTIRGGSVSLRMDDILGGAQLVSGSNALTLLSTNNTLEAPSGTNIISGDATSPVKAAFRVTPQDNAPSGAAVVGDMYVTSAGVLRICVTAGTPCGSWVNVGAQ